MSELVNIDFSPGTIERYGTARSHTKDFINWKFGCDDLDINNLNYEFVADMEFYLKTVRKCCHNTSIKYISNVKKIVNICVKNGWLQRYPFFGYKMLKKEVIREYLSKSEIAAVLAKEFPAERLNVVRDIFIFSLYRPDAGAWDVCRHVRHSHWCGFGGLNYFSLFSITNHNSL